MHSWESADTSKSQPLRNAFRNRRSTNILERRLRVRFGGGPVIGDGVFFDVPFAVIKNQIFWQALLRSRKPDGASTEKARLILVNTGRMRIESRPHVRFEWHEQDVVILKQFGALGVRVPVKSN